MNVVVLGKGEMLANLISGVQSAGCNIVGVFRYERTVYNPLKLFLHDFFKSSPDVTLIKSIKLNEIKCKKANSDEFKELMLKLNVDVILVGTWKEKLKKEIINLPKIGTINVHPSLLPKYRGPNPYIQTILNGEKQSGITFHLMNENLDAGPILAQAKIDIPDSYTSKELRAKTVFDARILAYELFKKLEKGCVIPTEQDECQATYFGNITGDEKMLDFNNQTSTQIINTVRALHPFLPAYITCGKQFLIVNPYKIRLSNKSGKPNEIVTKCIKTRSLTIACKDGKCVKMSGLKLYHFPFLTKLFIKNLRQY